MGETIYITPREAVLVRLIRDGMTTEDIASRYEISRWTVRDRIRRLEKKLGGCRFPEIPAVYDAFVADGRIVEAGVVREE